MSYIPGLLFMFKHKLHAFWAYAPRVMLFRSIYMWYMCINKIQYTITYWILGSKRQGHGSLLSSSSKVKHCYWRPSLWPLGFRSLGRFKVATAGGGKKNIDVRDAHHWRSISWFHAESRLKRNSIWHFFEARVVILSNGWGVQTPQQSKCRFPYPSQKVIES